ncbi:MobA/MobL family protein, partial [Thermoguttaceae bacterium LCP21S3_D4]
MSIYHCSIKIISRSDGKSAVASSAYRSGEKLMDDRTGLVHDFTKKRGVVFT